MRYYWLRLKEDFFRDLRVKALRRTPNGEALVLLYLELLLSALETGGIIPLLGVDAPAQEIALLLDTDDETAAALLAALVRLGLLQETENGLFLPAVEALTGSEGESAVRMRRSRAKKADAEPKEPASFFAPSQCAHNVPERDTEKEIEQEIEQETDPEKESELNPSLPASPASSAPAGADLSALRSPNSALPPPNSALPSISLPTNEKQKQYVVGNEKLKEYGTLWPELDIRSEFLAMKSWLLANPERRKSPAETPRFVNGWLSRAREKVRAAPANQPEPRQTPRHAAGRRSAEETPPSYDIEKAMIEMMTTMPKVKKRPR